VAGAGQARWPGLSGPDEILTANGKQFTGPFGRGGEVLFDNVCRHNGITQPVDSSPGFGPDRPWTGWAGRVRPGRPAGRDLQLAGRQLWLEKARPGQGGPVLGRH